MNAPWDLIDGYLDGQLTSEEEVRFQDWLKSDPEHLRCFVREVHFHQSLRAELQVRRAASRAISPSRTVENGAPIPFPQRERKILSFRWQTALKLAASIALVAATLEWFMPQNAEPVLSGNFEGSLEVKRGAEVLRPSAGFKPQPNDFFTLSGTNSASLAYTSERTKIEFAPGSQWKVLPWNKGKRFVLQSGKLEASVARQRLFRPMIINTPQAEVRVLGTRFELAVTTNATRLDVTEGKVRFTRASDHAAVKVPAGRYAVAAVKCELAALPFTGTILREWWSGIKSIDTFADDPRFPDRPDRSELVQKFELAPVNTNKVAVRFCGYLHPPVTGDYEISLAGPLVTPSETVLYMSSSENPDEKGPIARVGSKGYNQAPPPIPLVAGRRYYIEATILIDQGEGSLSVAWKRPGGSREPLTGEFLSPFKLTENKP